MNLKKKVLKVTRFDKMDEENGSVVYGIEFSECIWEEFQEKCEINVCLTKWRKKTVPFFMIMWNFTKYQKQKVNWIGIFWAKSVKVKWEIY